MNHLKNISISQNFMCKMCNLPVSLILGRNTPIWEPYFVPSVQRRTQPPHLPSQRCFPANLRSLICRFFCTPLCRRCNFFCTASFAVLPVPCTPRFTVRHAIAERRGFAPEKCKAQSKNTLRFAGIEKRGRGRRSPNDAVFVNAVCGWHALRISRTNLEAQQAYLAVYTPSRMYC